MVSLNKIFLEILYWLIVTPQDRNCDTMRRRNHKTKQKYIIV